MISSKSRYLIDITVHKRVLSKTVIVVRQPFKYFRSLPLKKSALGYQVPYVVCLRPDHLGLFSCFRISSRWILAKFSFACLWISDHFPKSPKIFRRPNEHFPEIFEDYRRFPKITEDCQSTSIMHQQVISCAGRAMSKKMPDSIKHDRLKLPVFVFR